MKWSKLRQYLDKLLDDEDDVTVMDFDVPSEEEAPDYDWSLAVHKGPRCVTVCGETYSRKEKEEA